MNEYVIICISDVCNENSRYALLQHRNDNNRKFYAFLQSSPKALDSPNAVTLIPTDENCNLKDVNPMLVKGIDGKGLVDWVLGSIITPII